MYRVPGRIRGVFQTFDTFLIDCDGVLWHQDNPIPGSSAAISALLQQNKRVIFVSNNCGKTVDDIQEKFRKLLHLNDIPSKNIITSAVSTAIYLKNKIKDFNSEKVYLIAQSAFKSVLKDHGIESFGLGPAPPRSFSDWGDFQVDKSVKYVIASYDPDFSYNKVTEAFLYLTENSAQFISPDVDQCFSVRPGRKIPGSLIVQSAISAAAEKVPVITGKPDPFMLELIEGEHGAMNRNTTIMIGDNYNTDIMFGKNCGISTAVVFTGNRKEGDVEMWAAKPDHLLGCLGDILEPGERS